MPTNRAATFVLSCTATLLLFGCDRPGNELSRDESSVVYGSDNRRDVYAHPDDLLRTRAEMSTVALVATSVLDASDPTNIRFDSDNLGVVENLCETERFRFDPTAAFCTGTLIDDDLVLTAGHCITDSAKCARTRFVFNYYRTGEGVLKPITSEDVFSCSAIVVRELLDPWNSEGDRDYAIIRLDRPATPRFTPAPVMAEDESMAVGQPVAVIGSGSGVPFKIDSGGRVRDAGTPANTSFLATTDTFGGNSGSAVYELEGHSIVGILVRGEYPQYVPNGQCSVVRVCNESECRGEGVTYVRRAIDAYCSVAGSQRLCPGSGTNLKRTVVFIYGETQPGQDMFIRGGIDHDYANSQLGLGCATNNMACAIPIVHRNLRNATTAPWKVGDSFLDWYGAEQPLQSAHAQGSPLDWTTDVWPASWGPERSVEIDGFGTTPLNVYGRHYWMLDVDMDCSRTVDGWFELKSFISNGPGWEGDVMQSGAPYSSRNHFAQCGRINVFQRNSDSAFFADF